jgi:hypothetical protein
MAKKLSAFLIFFGVLPANTLAQTAPRPITPGAPPTIQHLTDLFANVIAVVVTLAGFAAFLMLIAGGFRYLTAQGDPKAAGSARGMLTWAIVGLAFVIFAWLILSFIADFTGLPLTTFCLPQVTGGGTQFCPGLDF